jgi:hypothetical protein
VRLVGRDRQQPRVHSLLPEEPGQRLRPEHAHEVPEPGSCNKTVFRNLQSQLKILLFLLKFAKIIFEVKLQYFKAKTI